MLRFGYNAGIPEGATCAWGCRAITNGGSVDVVWDRQDAAGPDDERQALLAYLNDHEKMRWRDRANELLRSGEMRSDQAQEFVLNEDDRVVVKGNTNGSFGYLYVAAYFKPAVEAAA